nr:rhabdomeric opsin [Batillipes sp.]
MIVAAFVLPLCIIFFCYINIYINSRKSSAFLLKYVKYQKYQSSRKTHYKLAKMALIYVSCWFIAWTPYCICALLPLIEKEDILSPWLVQGSALFAKAASVYNPVRKCVNNYWYNLSDYITFDAYNFFDGKQNFFFFN